MRKVLVILYLFSQIIAFAQRPADFISCYEEADYIKTWIGSDSEILYTICFYDKFVKDTIIGVAWMDFKFKDMYSLLIESVWFSDIIILQPKEMPNITYDSDTMPFFLDRLSAFYQNYIHFYYCVDTNTIEINCDCNSIGLTSKFMIVPCKHPKRKGITYGPKSCTLAMPSKTKIAP